MKLSIGQVSKIFNISTDTLRYYDKIGILTPEINKENGYRYYLLHHLEKLQLILGIKYLGISLSDIKNTIKNEDILEYKNLIIKQKEIIYKKIKELNELEKSLSNSNIILDKIINFRNEYDFSKLSVVTKNYNFYAINIKNLLALDFNKNNSYTLERDLVNVSQELYFYIYNIKENKYIDDDENIVLLEENHAINSLINEYKHLNKTE
ncbi:MerR family transcriptional regulator, partial [Clostridium tarantellae]